MENKEEDIIIILTITAIRDHRPLFLIIINMASMVKLDTIIVRIITTPTNSIVIRIQVAATDGTITIRRPTRLTAPIATTAIITNGTISLIHVIVSLNIEIEGVVTHQYPLIILKDTADMMCSRSIIIIAITTATEMVAT
jgi:hypothetical protein